MMSLTLQRALLQHLNPLQVNPTAVVLHSPQHQAVPLVAALESSKNSEEFVVYVVVVSTELCKWIQIHCL